MVPERVLSRVIAALEDRAYAVVDAHSGVFLRVSESFSAAVRYAPSELLGRPVSFIETRFFDEAVFTEHIADLTDRPRTVLALLRRSDGTTLLGEVTERRVDDRSRALVVATLNPLRNAPEVLERVAESETRFRHLFECANDAIFIVDRETNLLVAANRRTSELFGYSRNELLTKTVFELLDEASAARIPEIRARLDRGDSSPYEFLCRRSDGELRIAEASSCATNMAGRPCVLAIYRDITERKKLEAKVDAQTKRLEEANLELQEFAAMAAHDLKAPLQTMTGFSQLLERRAGPLLAEEERRYLHQVTAASRRMARVIDDLLNYARGENVAAESAKVDTDAVLDEALAALASAREQAAATVTRGPLPSVTLGRTHLLQLLQNLIGNAIQFRRPEVPPQISVTAETVGDRVHFRVDDNGLGVPPADRKRIFRPFVRLAASSAPGSGLGLATCRRVVERYGGSIAVRDRESGEGSTFVFDLPAV